MAVVNKIEDKTEIRFIFMASSSKQASPRIRQGADAVDAKIGERDLNIESSYEYGARAGYWRLLKAFTDRELVGTVNLVGVAGQANPYALDAMIEFGNARALAGGHG